MQFCKREPYKISFFDRIKCIFGKHDWGYWGTFNDEFNLDDITNERTCMVCRKHQTEVDLNLSIWKTVK